VVSGGRVLGVTATAADLAGAVNRAYEAAAKISFEGAQYRHDIGATGAVPDGRGATRSAGGRV